MWLGYCQEGLGWDVRGDSTENRGWEEQGETGMRFPTPTGIDLPTGDMAQASQCCWCKQSWQEPWQGACVTRGTAPSLAPLGTIQVTPEAHTSHSGHPQAALRLGCPQGGAQHGDKSVRAEGGGTAAWGHVLGTREGRALAVQGICHWDWGDSL